MRGKQKPNRFGHSHSSLKAKYRLLLLGRAEDKPVGLVFHTIYPTPPSTIIHHKKSR